MKTRKPKKSFVKPLSLKQIVALASSRAVFSEPTWTRVALTFALVPEIIGELREMIDTIPAPPSPDPIISAIRRICHPTDRLPWRHRGALANVGTSILSFSVLALEEARTSAWRCLDREPIGRVASWLKKTPLASYEHKASLELAYLASSYNVFCVARFGPQSEFISSQEWILEPLAGTAFDSWIFAEACMAQAMMLARTGQHTKAKDHLQVARDTLERSTQNDLVDLDVFLKLTQSWLDTVLEADPLQVEIQLTEALGALNKKADPWLALFLHHEAAKSAITFVVSRVLNDDVLARLRLEEQVGISQQARLEQSFRRLQEVFYDHGSGEADAILRALAHLEACDDLFQEFRTNRLTVVHDWLWAHALVHTDPIEGVHRIVRAITLAIEMDLGDRLEPMLKDVFYLISQLPRSAAAKEKKADCLSRVRGVLQLADQYQRKKRKKTPESGGGGSSSPVQVAIFDGSPLC